MTTLSAHDAGPPSISAIEARRDRLFGRGAPLFYEHPVHLVRGDGVWLFDADGRRYLDAYNNVPVVGHCNPRVSEALAKQSATHQTHSRYLDTVILDYAERLLALHDPSLEHVVFACTGTEANEIALQMARIATGGRGFVTTTAAYHGSSSSLVRFVHAPRRGRRDVNAFTYPQLYRPIEDGLSEDELTSRYLVEVEAAIADFKVAGVPFAGMLICPLFANEGMPDVPTGFLAKAAELVRAAGGVVIFDEVQAGFGRVGSWWAYQQCGVVPDIVTTGKPMGNGYPLAACVGRADIVGEFRARTSYINTFAASPVQGAIGLAVLDEMEDRDVVRHADDVGRRVAADIASLVTGVDVIGDVRRKGLFVGVECVTDRASRDPNPQLRTCSSTRSRDRGVLISRAGEHRNVVKIRPPLVFEFEHADVLAEAFAGALTELP